MFRMVGLITVPLLWAIWQSFDQESGGDGQGSGSGTGNQGSAGGQTGGAGASGSGGSSGGSGTGQNTGTDGGGDPLAEAYGFSGDFNPEVARKLIDKLRPYETEAAQLKGKVAELTEQIQGYEAQGQSELEQAQTRVANLEADVAKLQQENRQLKVRVLAGDMGVVDTQAASLLLKWDELGEDPDEETVKAALNAMVQDRPWLTGATSQQRQQQRPEVPNNSGGNTGRTGNGGAEKKIGRGRSRLLAGITAAAKK